jgi:hypothetical protein
MKNTTPIAVWLFLVVASVGEVLLEYSGPGKMGVDIGIGIIAMVSGLVTALILMDLRKEPSVVQYMMLAPLALVMVLILTMMFALGH